MPHKTVTCLRMKKKQNRKVIYNYVLLYTFTHKSTKRSFIPLTHTSSISNNFTRLRIEKYFLSSIIPIFCKLYLYFLFYLTSFETKETNINFMGRPLVKLAPD